MRPLLLVLALAPLAVAAVSAQPAYRPPAEDASVSLDVLTGVGDDLDGVVTDDQGAFVGASRIRVLSTVALLSARVPVGGRWTVVGEVPFAYVRARGSATLDPSSRVPAFESSDAQLGNPYLGAEVWTGAGLTLGAGVRLPLAQFDETPEPVGAVYAGLTADTERSEAHLAETLAFSAVGRYVRDLTPGLGLRLGLVPVYLVDTSGARGGSDVALGYQAHLNAAFGRAVVSAGAVGRRFLTDNTYAFVGSDVAVSLGAAVEVGGVRPGLQARVPLVGNDYLGVDAVVGLSLDVPLR